MTTEKFNNEFVVFNNAQLSKFGMSSIPKSSIILVRPYYHDVDRWSMPTIAEGGEDWTANIKSVIVYKHCDKTEFQFITQTVQVFLQNNHLTDHFENT